LTLGQLSLEEEDELSQLTLFVDDEDRRAA
jgi:hypothetical protein